MFKKVLLSSLLVFTLPLYAAKPLFSIVPVPGYPNKISIPANQTDQVRYLVTNNVKQRQTVVFKPKAGLTQVLGSGFCGAKTSLNTNESCVLVLDVNMSGLSQIIGGPEICQSLKDTTQPNLFFCSEPNASDALFISLDVNAYKLYINLTGLPNVAGASVNINDGSTSATYTSNGTYILKNKVLSGDSYFVTATNVNNAVCTVNNGVGSVSNADVTVDVVCASSSFLVGGTITGLIGNLTLLNNLQYSVTKTGAGAYSLPPAANGSSYSVTVGTKPNNQTCTVTNPTGKVNGANVSNVNVYCSATTYTLGGTISGLSSGQKITLSSSAQNTSFSSNGAFTFPTAYAKGTVYNVSIVEQPTNSYCVVTNGSGTLFSNLNNVAVVCHPLNYTYGGQIYNLFSPIVLTTTVGGVTTTQDVLTNGSLELGKIYTGASYNVAISTQSSGQTCQIVNSSGTITNASVNNIDIYCDVNASLKTLGGTIHNTFSQGGSYVLKLSNGINNSNYENNNVPQSTSTLGYSFPSISSYVSGTPYNINFITPVPTPSLTFYCSLLNASDSIPAAADAVSSEVYCADVNYQIRGTVSGLVSGESVVLTTGQSQVTETVSANGAFTLNVLRVPKGATWKLTVAKQPATTYCNLTNNQGSGQAADNINVTVDCSASASSLFVYDNHLTVPVGGSANVTIYNQGPSVVSDLKLNLPSGWLGVTQTPNSACTNLAVGAQCQINVATTKAYPPAGNLTITGKNVGSAESINMAFTVGGEYVFNTKGTQAYVVRYLNDSTSSPIYTSSMPAPSSAVATSLYEGTANTAAWNTFYNGYTGYGLAFQTCLANNAYLPSACEWGPPGSTVNSSVCQGSGIYNLINLGFLDVNLNHSFWTSTQSSSTYSSIYAVTPGQASMSLNNGTTSNYVICVNWVIA